MPGTGRRRTQRIALACAAGLIALGAPSAASAVVYCVPNDAIGPIGGTPCDPGQGQPTIQAAFTAASASGGIADTVLIGPGGYSEANPTYNNQTATNVITVVGAGTAQTLLTIPDTTGTAIGMTVSGPPGSSVSNLAMTIPANADANGDEGISLGGSVLAHDVFVDGPAATNARGIRMRANTSLDDSTVDLPFAGGNIAVSTLSANTLITDSLLHAVTGVRHGGTLSQVSTIDRSTIEASGAGVSEDSGSLVVRDSVIDLGTNSNSVGAQAANFNHNTSAMSIALTGVTIVGGGANSTGVHAQADSDATPPVDGTDMNTDGEEANITVSSTFIGGPTVPLRIEADRGERATISTSYSNYNTIPTVITSDLTPGGGIGEANLNESNRTNFNPDFVSPGTGDYHLAGISQLIDRGDPAMSPPDERDIDGDLRDVLGNDGCGARRDIGADEFIPLTPPTLLDCIPPDTTASGPAKLKLKKKKKKRASASYSLSTEAGATLECSLDSAAFTPCSSPHVLKLRKGTHTLSVRSRDAAGNVDASPATVVTKVVRKKAKKK